jgi:ribosomal protein S18 acetylase RimI-like enzyme
MLPHLMIKKITADELPLLVKISQTTFYHTYHAFNTEQDMQLYLNSHMNEEAIKGEWNNPNNEFYFAWLNENLAGYCKLSYQTQPDHFQFSNALEIARLYVNEPFKKLGIGKQFIAFAEDLAQQKNLEQIWLIAWQQNKSAIAFYQKVGFCR